MYPVQGYIDMRTKIKHRCVHGHEALVTPRDVSINRIGCPVCAGRRSSDTYTQVLEPMNLVLVDEYKGSQKPLDHFCLNCEHVWTVRPADITSGNRTCPTCKGRSSKTSESMGKLYYVKVTYGDTYLYKIGITSRTLKTRFGTDFPNVTVLLEQDMLLKEAYAKEQSILRKYSFYRANLDDVLLNGGNTELFDRDVLKLDTNS